MQGSAKEKGSLVTDVCEPGSMPLYGTVLAFPGVRLWPINKENAMSSLPLRASKVSVVTGKCHACSEQHGHPISVEPEAIDVAVERYVALQKLHSPMVRGLAFSCFFVKWIAASAVKE